MFEIIMLFAFLSAATCQLLPKRSVTAETLSSKKNHPDKGKARGPYGASKKASKPSAKTKSRKHSYALAA